MQVRVIFFDLDGTLVWIPGQKQADWFVQILQNFGVSPDPQLLERAYHDAEQRWQSQIRPKLGFSSASFTEWNRMILEELGLNGNLRDLAERIQRYWESPPDQIFPEVPAALAELKRRGIRLGIMSHRPLAGIAYTLQRHSIKSYFEWLASPDAVDAPQGKLDGALWAKLLRSAGAGPNQAIHVGDDFETDIRGPRRAGLHAVWIERPELKGRFYPGRLSPHCTNHIPANEHACAHIADLQQLVNLVRPA